MPMLRYSEGNSLKAAIPREIPRLIFFIFWAVTIFGLSIPFQDPPSDPSDIETSNILNQVIYSSLYLVAFICLIPVRDKVLELIIREKFFFLFLFWCFLSVLWSEFPLVSIKRYVHLLGTSFIFLAMICNQKSSEESLNIFKILFMVYLPINLLAVFFVSAAIQWEFPAWRGIAPHKNMLGQAAMISLFIWSFSLSLTYQDSGFKNYFFLALSLILLIGARSATCLVTLLAIMGLFIANGIDKKIFRPLIGVFLSWSFFAVFLLIVSLFLILFPETIPKVLQLIGKNPDLARLDLWLSIMEEVRNHWFFGTGYAGYWVMDSNRILILFEDHVWLPNQAHMGYLDILNETGIIGLSILSVMVIRYFLTLNRIQNPHFWSWAIITILILNLTESTFFKPLLLTGALFNFAYLNLFAITENSIESDGTGIK